jgi:hypothetical protein
VEGGEEVGRGQKKMQKLCGSPLLLHRGQQELMMIMNVHTWGTQPPAWSELWSCHQVSIITS